MRSTDVRAVFRLVSDVRELRADPVAARKRIADGLCDVTRAVHGFTLDLEGMTAAGKLVSRQMVIGGHPDPKGLAYLIESQRENHFRYIDPTTHWACHCRARRAVARQTEMFPLDVWRTHPYFTTHYRPAGLGPLMIGFYRREHFGDALGVSVARPLGDANFSDRDRGKLALFINELIDLRRRGLFDPPHLERLTARQREVLHELLLGRSLKQLARALGISALTADDHVKAVYRRLGVNSRAELLSRYLLPVESRRLRAVEGGSGPIFLS